jgi:crotonobetainyl-CoA:carnitine CoA-transferase CaiB-like acyl-CoA transferase
MDLPLEGVRVVELTDGLGELAGRFLGELGADVVRVDAPCLRPRDAVYRATHDLNKRSVSLDLAQAEDRAGFEQLLAHADILLESTKPGVLEDVSLSPEALRARFPGLVIVSVTDFGRSGPYRDWVATEGVHHALGGVLSRSGLPGREPLLPPGSLATESAALQATWAALVAYTNRLDTGSGDLVDVSVYESTVQVLDPGYGIGGSATGGVPAAEGPRGRPDARHLYPMFPCLDGWVRICVLSPRQWQGMFRWLGEPEELADPQLASLGRRFAASERILPAIARLLAGKTRDEVVAEGQAFGVPTAALLDPAEVLTAEQFVTRGALVQLKVGTQPVIVPDGLVEVDGRRAGMRRPAPCPGEHTAEVLAEVLAEVRVPRAPQDHVVSAAGRPLEGLRVLDLGVIVVGAELGRLLADLGAEVVKVENQAFPDGSRQSTRGGAISPGFAWGHRNKLGLGLNLRDPRGIALFKDLVAQSDVVLSNFKPGTMESLGLGADVLLAVNPRIVVADSSAFGPTGPWSARMGYGPLVRAAAGLSGLWRYPDDPTSFSDASTIYPDHVAARVGAVGVLALLLRRRRTGRGGTVSVAQAETILVQLGHHLAAEQLGMAPQPAGTVYPCAGDDEWCVVGIRDDADAARLREVVGGADVAAWMAARPPRQAMEELQAAGVPAGMMQRIRDYSDDPHLLDRRLFRTMEHPLLGVTMPCEGLPARFTALADVPLAPAPLPGEHSEQVLMNVLGMSAEDVASLAAEGVVELAAVPAPA